MGRPVEYREPRTAWSIRMRADLAEMVDELAREMVVSRNKVIEYAVEMYMKRLDLAFGFDAATAEATRTTEPDHDEGERA